MIGGTKTASEIPCLAENRTMWFRGVQCVVISVLALLAAIAVAPAVDGQRRIRTGPQAILGRWDLTFKSAEEEYPSWLEVRLSGRRTLVAHHQRQEHH